MQQQPIDVLLLDALGVDGSTKVVNWAGEAQPVAVVMVSVVAGVLRSMKSRTVFIASHETKAFRATGTYLLENVLGLKLIVRSKADPPVRQSVTLSRFSSPIIIFLVCSLTKNLKQNERNMLQRELSLQTP